MPLRTEIRDAKLIVTGVVVAVRALARKVLDLGSIHNGWELSFGTPSEMEGSYHQSNTANRQTGTETGICMLFFPPRTTAFSDRRQSFKSKIQASGCFSGISSINKRPNPFNPRSSIATTSKVIPHCTRLIFKTNQCYLKLRNSYGAEIRSSAFNLGGGRLLISWDLLSVRFCCWR